MTYLVTGAQGFIGSWVVKNLIESGRRVVVYDLDTQPKRLAQILSPAQLREITFVARDVCDLGAIEHTIKEHGVTKIIHLVGLQIPACQADPRAGAMVNVVGTINVFEAALASKIGSVVYASSAAVAGKPEDYDEKVFTPTSIPRPRSHYGVFKQCNEGNARIYFETRGLSSVGLRPWAGYGVGRDFGLTSDPTKAIKAAVMGIPFKIQFGGCANMQYADDVAKIFILCCDAGLKGAYAFNLQGDVLHVDQMIDSIEKAVPSAKGLITHGDMNLPLISAFDDSDLRGALGVLPHTEFEEGVRQTVEIFQALRAQGRLPSDEIPAAASRA
jgi:nucleoside-diphosphate-sugar epimerase